MRHTVRIVKRTVRVEVTPPGPSPSELLAEANAKLAATTDELKNVTAIHEQAVKKSARDDATIAGLRAELAALKQTEQKTAG